MTGDIAPAGKHLLAHLTWPDAKKAAEANRLVIVPTGAIEAHGPHLPLDIDTQQVEVVSLRLAERIGALVAPAVVYGYSTTFMGFAGTVSCLQRPTSRSCSRSGRRSSKAAFAACSS